MLRLLISKGLYGLWTCDHFVASCVAKRQITRFLNVSSAGHHGLHKPARHFNTGIPVCKDALQLNGDNPEEKLDLDKWKSVMRAQAATEDKVSDVAEASDDDEDPELVDELNTSSSLEAARDLVTMWRYAGKLVPQEMTDDELQMVASLTTKSARKKYLKYLYIREGHKRSRKAKQQQKAEKRALIEQERGDGEEKHELENTFFSQLWTRSMDKFVAWTCARAMIFGQPLVFDMSYESNMARREIENTVTQLMNVEGWNRRAADPYHLHFCNLKADGACQKELLRRYGAGPWERLLITSTDQQYVDVFPREQLVYLTPDSPNVLRTYDHSKVYIIGGLVDRAIQPGLSLANAKRLNLATARLPLDEYLKWEIGSKNLTLDQMIRIMLTLKDTGNWEEALKFVPRRKYGGFNQQSIQKEATSIRGVANNGPRHDGDRQLRPRERNYERTFKNQGQSFNRSHKEPGFSSRDMKTGLSMDRENKPAATKVRMSFKNNMEGRRGAGGGKLWWDDE